MRDDDKIEIPIHVWETVCSSEAYFDRHLWLRENKYTSNFDAWAGLEAERAAYNIPPRYTSFESFKTNRYKYILEKLNKK
jgi:hypothetical protein